MENSLIIVSVFSIVTLSAIIGIIFYFSRKDKKLLETLNEYKNEIENLKNDIKALNSSLKNEMTIFKENIKTSFEEIKDNVKNLSENIEVTGNNVISSTESIIEKKYENLDEKIRVIIETLYNLIDYLQTTLTEKIARTVKSEMEYNIGPFKSFSESLYFLSEKTHEDIKMTLSKLKKMKDELEKNIEENNKELEKLSSIISYIITESERVDKIAKEVREIRESMNKEIFDILKSVEILKELVKELLVSKNIIIEEKKRGRKSKVEKQLEEIEKKIVDTEKKVAENINKKKRKKVLIKIPPLPIAKIKI